MARKKWSTAGIDVGTTKICTCIAEVDGDRVEVLGTGVCRSEGLQKGLVVNLSKTIASVKSAIEKAEKEAGTVIESAWVSVGSQFIRGTNSQAETEIRGKNGRVTREDVQRVVELARAFELPEDYQVLHTLPQVFRLDQQEGVLDPLGMTGHRLSVSAHVVVNANAVVDNVTSAINRAGVVVREVVMQQLASGEAVLTPDEKELGCVLVDIGGGTTDIAVYHRGRIWHSEVIPMGGSLITKDIALGLRAPMEEAEQLKIRSGSVFPHSVAEEEIVQISEMGTGRLQSFSRRSLCQIVEARCDEIILAVAHTLRRAGVQPDVSCGIVMTGGGALMDGLVERAAEQLGMPVRLGRPLGFGDRRELIHPSYSTALGLLRYAVDKEGSLAGFTTRPNLFTRPWAATEWVKSFFLERI